MSPLSAHRLSKTFVIVLSIIEVIIVLILSLGLVKRKTLVLDLDETLIHSQHDGVTRQTVKPGTPPDFILRVTIDRNPVRFYVHKRPHVDYFLNVVRTIITIMLKAK